MRRIVMLVFLVVLLTSLSAAFASESSAGSGNWPPAGREPVFDSEAQLCAAATMKGIDAPDAPRTASSSGTWLWSFGPESCLDWCGGSCTWSCPAAPCPANPAGQACSPYGAECYVKSGSFFDYYVCW